MSLNVSGIMTLLKDPTVNDKNFDGKKAWIVNFWVSDSKMIKGANGETEWISHQYNISQIVYKESLVDYYKMAKKLDKIYVSGYFDYFKSTDAEGTVKASITPYELKIIHKEGMVSRAKESVAGATTAANEGIGLPNGIDI